jgi:hypothetical protein
MALTQADLARLEAQHQAVQAELLKIVTKTGVSAEQRAIDNARIKVLNKRAADIVAEQRSAKLPAVPTKAKETNPTASGSKQKSTATPATLDKKAALDAKLGSAQETVKLLKNKPNLTDAEKRKLNVAQRDIIDVQLQFTKDKDLLALAGQNMSPADKLFATGLALGTVGGPGASTAATALITTAAAVAGAEVAVGANKEEPDTSKSAPDAIFRSREQNQIDISGPPLPNVLHQYPNYTYSISLHLMSPGEYNNIVKDQKYTPKRVLIASAGRYDANTFPRSEFFKEDFYFEDLEIETVIGLNAMSRNTNAIKIAFTVIEPYGLTLMERLIKAAEQVGANSYLEMAYLLQIDFFAHNDAGEIVGKLSDISKYIPIKIAKMGIKAGVKGSEYAIEAFPFNHSAYNQTTITTPKHIEVTAGSIADFFASVPVEITAANTTDNSQREVTTSPFGTTQTIVSTPLALQNQITSARSDTITASSYPTALNKFYLELKQKNQIGAADQYTFTFDEEILAYGKFKTINNLATHQSNKMADRKNTSPIRISNLTNRASSDIDPSKKIFAIDAGTSIDKVINFVVRMSDYVQLQLAVPEDSGENSAAYLDRLNRIQNEYLNWFKIVPTVRLGEWDNRRKVWQRYINYHVQTYIVKNVKSDIAPQKTASNPVKKYEYLYSGKNDDIIDWDLQFNALYYTAMTVYKNARAVLSSKNNEEEIKDKAPSSYNGVIQDPNAVTPNVMQTVISQAQATAGSDAFTAREMAVADLDESLITMSGADQLQVNLKIIGDPAYIKQDDIFYPPDAFNNVQEPDPGVDLRLTLNNSLRTDFGELYVQLLFKTPDDVNESTGMMFEPNDKKQTSVFSGLFKVLTVTSNFSQGAFTQVLNLIRLPRQTEFDYTSPRVPKTNERQEVDENIAQDTPVEDSASTLPPLTGDSEDGKAGVDTVAAEDPTVDPEQENLADVVATAPTQTINDQTEPQTTVPLQEKLSFNETFRRARAANGGRPGGLFEWNGNQYQTNIVGEEYVGNPIPVTFNKF